MKLFIKKHFFPLLILVISIILVLTNYKPGTFLVGWDNLFPEFNPLLNIKRDLFAVWQQYRGLGALDNFAHSNNLVHDVFRSMLSFIFPLEAVRWIFMFIMHFLGGLGMYYLIIYLFGKELRKHVSVQIAAFIASLFYQYNIGTIQQFFLPLEVFVFHFAFLPWLFLGSLHFFHTGTKKYLLLFAILSFVATPQAFVPTVFAVYLLGIILTYSALVITHQFKPTYVLRMLLIILVIFFTNAFWILPTTRSFLTYRQTVSNAKNYQMASNDLYYRNKKYGNFVDVSLIKGVPLEYQSMDFKSNRNVFMMQNWLDYMNKPQFFIPGWVFFLLAVFGLLNILIGKKRLLLPFALVFFVSFSVMGTEIPIIGNIFTFWRTYLPVVSAIFRFIFTKFSILYVFSYSILLSVGIYSLLRLLHDRLKIVIGTALFLSVIIYAFPAFRGHFFYENLAVKIPAEYFQVFDFFKKQNTDERIASLPILWYWAWTQPSWGTINSGFLWYGIKQPMTDLAFTPWGRENENFYWEFDRAIYSREPSLVKQVLRKYDITWILLDENIYNNPGRKMTYDMYESLIGQTEGLKSITPFGKIKIFGFEKRENLHNFVTIKNNLPLITPNPSYDDYDSVYINEGDYISVTQSSNVYYPFRSLFSGKSPRDIEYNIKEDLNDIIFKAAIPSGRQKFMRIPNVSEDEFLIYRNQGDIVRYSPSFFVDKEQISEELVQYSNQILRSSEDGSGEIEMRFDKNQILEYANYNDKKFLDQTNNSCDIDTKGIAKIEKQSNGYKLTSIHSNNCIKVELPSLSQKYGYILNVWTVNDTKRGLHLNLMNTTIAKSDFETYVDNDGKEHNYFFVIAPGNRYGLGYTLYINNISEGQEKVMNTLKGVKVYRIPYYFLKNIKVTDGNQTLDKQYIFEVQSKQINTALYKIRLEQKYPNNSILYLSQSYNPGWIAFADGKLLPHVLVNNWANGWKLPIQNSESRIQNVVIIFWPQYLEFMGFGLLIVGFLLILFYQPKIKVDDKNS